MVKSGLPPLCCELKPLKLTSTRSVQKQALNCRTNAFCKGRETVAPVRGRGCMGPSPGRW